MMGERQVDQGALFYEFSLERHVPVDHLLRAMDHFVDLGDVRAHMAPFYSATGRPSVDPELLIRMLLIGYCYGIRSERRLCEEVHLESGISVVLPSGPRRRRSGPFHVLEEPPWTLPRQRPDAPPVRNSSAPLRG